LQRDQFLADLKVGTTGMVRSSCRSLGRPEDIAWIPSLPSWAWLCTSKGDVSVDDFLMVMGAVVFVCLSAAGWALWSLRTRNSKRDNHQ
jgi:hypothetical protein